MNQSSPTRTWVFEEMAGSLASALETMAGHAPEIRWEAIAGAVTPASERMTWRQSFENPPGTVWISIARTDCDRLCEHILRSAGLETIDSETIPATYSDLTGQFIDRFSLSLRTLLEKEVVRGKGAESADEPAGVRLAIFHVALPDALEVEITIGLDPILWDALTNAVPNKSLTSVPKALDRLLDVELPVSVSFGRAQIALKDALKLTTGSILELDRTIAEPVDVIVNNCAIARGEVVVVEGNFGVRILQVISRQERLKTVS